MPGKTDVYPYARVKQKKAGEKKRNKPKKRKPIFSRNVFNQLKNPTFLILAGTGFFLGRAVFLGELVPFAVAFVATATCLFPAYGLASTIGVIIGLITVIKGFPLVAASSTVILAELFLKFRADQIKKPRFMVPGLVLVFTIVTKSSFLAFTNPSLYDFISLLFEAVFAALLTLVCFNALYPWQKKADFASLSGEELFCLLVVLVGIIAGMGDWQIGFYIRERLFKPLSYSYRGFNWRGWLGGSRRCSPGGGARFNFFLRSGHGWVLIHLPDYWPAWEKVLVNQGW